MPRIISLTARSAFNAEETGEQLVVLCEFNAGTDDVVRLSSHPTTRLDDDPLRYGTIHQGEEYGFVLMNAILPDDQDGAATSSTALQFENVADDMAAVVRAVSEPVDVRLILVLASAPDIVEEEYTDLKTLRATYSADSITVEISRDQVASEPWPAHRQTKRRFPGLYR